MLDGDLVDVRAIWLRTEPFAEHAIVSKYAVAQMQLVGLDQLEHRGGGDRLGQAGDAKEVARSDRLSTRWIRKTIASGKDETAMICQCNRYAWDPVIGHKAHYGLADENFICLGDIRH
jgi:hypothetical protein